MFNISFTKKEKVKKRNGEAQTRVFELLCNALWYHRISIV